MDLLKIQKGPGYFKLNNSVLLDTVYQDKIKDLQFEDINMDNVTNELVLNQFIYKENEDNNLNSNNSWLLNLKNINISPDKMM